MPATLSAVVRLDPKPFQSGLAGLQNIVSNATGAMALAFGGVAGEILAMGRAFGPAGATVAALRPIIDTGAKFEQAMANVASVTGLAGKELEGLGEAARDIASKTAFTAGH